MYITNFTIMFRIQLFERFTNYVSAYKGNTSPRFFILHFWMFTSVSEKPMAFIKSSYTIVGQLEYLLSESGTLEKITQCPQTIDTIRISKSPYNETCRIPYRTSANIPRWSSCHTSSLPTSIYFCPRTKN